MSRIIFLSDVFDVKNEHTVPRSHFLNDEHRRRLYENSLKENYEFLGNNDPVGNIKMPKYTSKRLNIQINQKGAPKT